MSIAQQQIAKKKFAFLTVCGSEDAYCNSGPFLTTWAKYSEGVLGCSAGGSSSTSGSLSGSSTNSYYKEVTGSPTNASYHHGPMTCYEYDKCHESLGRSSSGYYKNYACSVQGMDHTSLSIDEAILFAWRNFLNQNGGESSGGGGGGTSGASVTTGIADTHHYKVEIRGGLKLQVDVQGITGTALKNDVKFIANVKTGLLDSIVAKDSSLSSQMSMSDIEILDVVVSDSSSSRTKRRLAGKDVQVDYKITLVAADETTTGNLLSTVNTAVSSVSSAEMQSSMISVMTANPSDLVPVAKVTVAVVETPATVPPISVDPNSSTVAAPTTSSAWSSFRGGVLWRGRGSWMARLVQGLGVGIAVVFLGMQAVF